MESRIIYESNKTYSQKLVWTKPIQSPDSEWIYIGLADQLNKKLVFKIIDEHFIDNDLYLSHSRVDSYQLSISEFKTKIDQYVGTWDFTLWDMTFTSAIQFNKIGILRRGTTIKL